MKHTFIILLLITCFSNCFSQIRECTNKADILEELGTINTYVPPITDYKFWNDKKIITLIDIVDSSIVNDFFKLHNYNLSSTLQDKISFLEFHLLNDTLSYSRVNCAKALRILNSKASIPILIKSLHDKNINVRFESALSLSYLGEKDSCFLQLKKIFEAGVGKKTQCCEGFKVIATKNATNMLIKALSDAMPVVKTEACVNLIQMGIYKPAYDTLVSLTHDNHYFVIRLSALFALSRYFHDEQTKEIIKSHLNDSNDDIKTYSRLFLDKYY